MTSKLTNCVMYPLFVFPESQRENQQQMHHPPSQYYPAGILAEEVNAAVRKVSGVEPSLEKTNNLGFQPGPTQNGLYSQRIGILENIFISKSKLTRLHAFVKLNMFYCCGIYMFCIKWSTGSQTHSSLLFRPYIPLTWRYVRINVRIKLLICY